MEADLKTFRPIPFYFLTTREPEDYSREAIDVMMDGVQAAGFGGIVFFNKPPHGFDEKSYLSDFYFDALERFILSCRQRDLDLWVNDGFNFPPGDAAGRIAKVAPGLEQLRLKANGEGRLEVVKVPWGFPAFEDGESSRLFREIVYEGHKRRLGQYFGQGLKGFFSDADNRRINSGLCTILGDERYYPWSRGFSVEFRTRYGYSIEQYLKGLFSGNDGRVCRDYWRLSGELYQQWFANNAKWCAENGLDYTFHTSDTGPINWEKCHRSSLFSEGNSFSLLMHSPNPGTDHEILVLDGGTHYDSRLFFPKVSRGQAPQELWHPRFNDTSHDVRAKIAGSVAALKGAKRAMCEMFAATNWGVTYQDLRRIASWQIMQGITFIVPHAVHHRFLDWSKFFAPPEFIHGNNGFGIRAFNDMLARYCQAAAGGRLTAEVALICPTEECWEGKDTENFFQLFDRLNRYAGGFVICPRELAGQYSRVLDPMADSAKEPLDLPDVGISFDGGELLYMRRTLEDGTEYLLAANIWGEHVLQGTLAFQGKTYSIELEPGEIAVIGGPYEAYRTPLVYQNERRRWEGAVPVRWDSANLVPFNRSTVIKSTAPMPLTVYIPGSIVVTLDGVLLCNSVKPRTSTRYSGWETYGGNPLWDDEYIAYSFRLEDTKEHTLLLYDTDKSQVGMFEIPALLEGEFDVAYTPIGASRKAMDTYMLSMYEPESELLELSPRSQMLEATRGWEGQGGLFYSGMVEYDLGIAYTEPGDILLLELNGIAELVIDEVPQGQVVARPYRFILNVAKGEHHLVLRCYNTMGNRLERYAAASGLVGPVRLLHH